MIKFLLANREYSVLILVPVLQLGKLVVLIVLYSNGCQALGEFLNVICLEPAGNVIVIQTGSAHTLITPSVSVRKLKSPKRMYGTLSYSSLWKRCSVCSSARRRFAQYTDGYASIATKFDASWNRWMLIKSNTLPSIDQRVRRKPFRDHLHYSNIGFVNI